MDIYEVREADERIRHEEMVSAIERLNEVDDVTEIMPITASDSTVLAEIVNQMLEKGWQLHGVPHQVCDMTSEVGRLRHVWTQFVKR